VQWLCMNFALSDLGKIRKEFVFLGKGTVRARGSANDQQTLGDIALLIWPFASTRQPPEAFL
jgi:hypothetical protein